jgi:electron transfer flavoprotein alpha subunit
MKPSVLIVARHADRRIEPATWGLLAAARVIGDDISFAVLGARGNAVADKLATCTGSAVYAIQDPLPVPGRTDRQAGALAALLEDTAFTHLLLVHDADGTDMAPRLALTAGAACIPGVTAIRREGSDLLYTRPVMGGKLNARIRSRLPGVVITLLPGFFHAKPPDPAGRPGRVIHRTPPPSDEGVAYLEEIPGEAPAEGITDARVIVAAGNGVGDKEGLVPIRSLAALFHRSAVAGSRPVCDRGWLPYNRQVGVTGATVSPELYIACGISGAYQHVAAMQGSRLVVAINRDAKAPMCRCADICVIEDLTVFIQALLETAGKEPS